ncbi:MAG: protein arginine kinase [Phycisphaeraceae bacterium]|nr:protein arginine kinase [Phycisphaeraceae bacterium]|tara:strand:+ start:519 stop:1580 length:1062 start_codon:yes stop_codon:yes gene_type:complete
MTLGRITTNAGEWLRGAGPRSDVVLSSRVRLARNLAGFPFVSRSSRRQREEILERCRDQIMNGQLAENVLWVGLVECPQVDCQLLVERHLISRQHARANDLARAVAVDTNETFSIMVNEEDHLRIAVLRSGVQLAEAFEQVNRIDNIIEKKLDYAFSKRFGYLTACPTNVGTGMRVSVMLHLPALKLTGEIDKVRRAARDIHLAVRGLFGEGSEAHGDLYQISNQTTLGRSEQEILSEFEHTVVPQIIAYEQQARQALLQQRSVQLDDKIWRAWAILTQARMLGSEEVLTLLSHLRLGVNLGRIQTVDIQTINELFLLSQPAHLQKINGSAMEGAVRRQGRAELIRRRLGAAD